MGSPAYKRLFSFDLLCIGAVAANLVFVRWMLGGEALLMYQENGLLELAQLLLLACCLVIFGRHYLTSKGEPFRLVLLSFVLLAFTFFVRECDLRPFGLPEAITYFTDGKGRDKVLIPLWLLMVAGLARDYRRSGPMLVRFVSSAAGALFVICAVLLFIGILLDKSVIKMPPSRFYEELFEFNGYFVLLLAALASKKKLQAVARRVRARAPDPAPEILVESR